MSHFEFFSYTCLVTLFDHKLRVSKTRKNWTIFGIFNELLSTQNVNKRSSLRSHFAMLNDTFIVIFKHCEQAQVLLLLKEVKIRVAHILYYDSCSSRILCLPCIQTMQSVFQGIQFSMRKFTAVLTKVGQAYTVVAQNFLPSFSNWFFSFLVQIWFDNIFQNTLI